MFEIVNSLDDIESPSSRVVYIVKAPGSNDNGYLEYIYENTEKTFVQIGHLLNYCERPEIDKRTNDIVRNETAPLASEDDKFFNAFIL
jgi:hypothetical protein